MYIACPVLLLRDVICRVVLRVRGVFRSGGWGGGWGLSENGEHEAQKLLV